MAAQPETLRQRHLDREIPLAWITVLNNYLYQHCKRDIGFSFGCRISRSKLCSMLEKADSSFGYPDDFDLESLFARYDGWNITVDHELEKFYVFDKD